MPPSAVHWLAALYARTAALGLAVAQRIAAYLSQGFGALPAHQRAALVLAYFEGLTHVEIAQLAIGLRDPVPDSVQHP